MPNSLSICIIAGEASGDLIGARLISALQSLNYERRMKIVQTVAAQHMVRQSSLLNNELFDKILSNLTGRGALSSNFAFFGIGGGYMESVGCEMIGYYDAIAHIGVETVIFNFWKISRLFYLISRTIKERQPDIVITIDSSGFNFRLINKMRLFYNKLNSRPIFVHYVAPAVWAYKPERAKIVENLFDRILLLYRFESDYFTNIRSTVVGVDITTNRKPCALITNTSSYKAEQLSLEAINQSTCDQIISSYGVKPDEKVISILIGSRKGELNMHADVIQSSIMKVSQTMNNKVKFCFIVHNEGFLEVVKRKFQHISHLLSNCPLIFLSTKGHKECMMKRSDVIWTKCGTAAMESIFYGNPVIAFYKVGFLTAFLLKRKLTNKKMFFTLPNILSKKEVIRELIQSKFQVDLLVEATLELLFDVAKDAAARQKLADVVRLIDFDSLDENTSNSVNAAADRAAKAIFEELCLSIIKPF